jgi:hypothetical protein
MRRHELSDEEWAIIEPLLPRKSRGVPRVDDRRVINGILWRFRTGAPWRDVPERYGPRTTLYNRFVRWRAAGCGLRPDGPDAAGAPPEYIPLEFPRCAFSSTPMPCMPPDRSGSTR